MRVWDLVKLWQFRQVFRQLIRFRHAKVWHLHRDDVSLRPDRVRDLSPQPVALVAAAVQASLRQNNHEIGRALDGVEQALVERSRFKLINIEESVNASLL